MTLIAPPQPQQIRTKGLGPGFWPVTALLGALSIAFAAYVLFAPLDWVLPGESHEVADRAGDIDNLFKFMAIVGAAIFFYVAGYVVYFAIVFRRRRGEASNTIGAQVHDAPKLELWWTLIPVVLLVILTAFSIEVWAKIQFGTSTSALTMEVIGHQFYFEYRYPGLKGSIYSKTEAMHLPLGQPVRVLVTSDDVLHQFWVPEIRLKAAAVPGLVQNLNFTPTKVGRYVIVCSEFCGVDHSLMVGGLVIESPAAFEKWIAMEKVKTAAAASTIDVASGVPATGQTVFSQKCAACHMIASFDHKLVGPGLNHISDDPQHPTLVDGKPPTAQNIAEILVKGYNGPIGAMPNRQANGLSDKDIADLSAYLVSLK